MSIEYINRIANAAFIDGIGSGGTEVTSGGYKYHTFTSSGTFTVTQPGKFGVLVVGGGGSGGRAAYYTGYGSAGSGGGGSGGLIFREDFYLAAGSHTITIGAGAAANKTAGDVQESGSIGSSTTIVFDGSTIFEAVGGGGGGLGRAAIDQGPTSAATGGGMGYNQTRNYPGDGSYGIQGYGGGTASQGGGGGGGSTSAGSNGGSGASGNGGNGGNGTDLSTWATATSTGDSGYYASGGGGGQYNGATAGTGPSGGGGNGGADASTAAEDGLANTGGGGGGHSCPCSSSFGAGSGGSGLVIIRYAV